MISTRWATPPWNWSSRTSEPTETASSTRAVSSCGVETETSTPQLSLKSHWFLGWLTRATTRGTANSCLARSEMTRLSSSSPVAATTTSTVASPAASSEDTSQASAATQVMSMVGPQLLDELGVLLDDEHVVAVLVQVGRDGGADAPGTGDGDLHVLAVLGVALGPGQHLVELAQSVVEHRDVQDVAFLADQLARVSRGTPARVTDDQAQASGMLDFASGRPAHSRAGTGRSG